MCVFSKFASIGARTGHSDAKNGKTELIRFVDVPIVTRVVEKRKSYEGVCGY